MAEFSLVYTLATPGGTVLFNSGTDQLYLQGIAGLDGAPIRAPIDNRPQTHGGLVHPFLLGPRHITVDGLVYVASSGTDAGIASARRVLLDSLSAALLSILRAQGTLTWTPSGGTVKNLYVQHDQPLQVTGEGLNLKKFAFGLVAAEPTPF